jgi:uncharacterized membrane protein YedE/YeeE
MENLPFGVLAALAGLLAGAVLGLSARLGDFCTLGALESALYGDDQRRLRLWGVVLAVAIFGTYLAASFGLIDIGASFYHQIAWDPLASIFGGLLFGYGMAMAGNCGFGALVRFGGGDLRSLVVVVVMGVFAFVALSGPLAPLRIMLFSQTEAVGPQGIAAGLQALTGLAPLVTAGALAAGLLIWALAHEGLRKSPVRIAWGIAAGLAVVWSLIATSWLAHESFGAVQVEGLSFTAPVGRTLIWLMTSTAGGISFSVGTVFGVLGGALVGSLWRGLFRWEACEDPRELGRQVSGAAMMGVGGVIAMGCSIGQGVSGFATLAWSGPVTLAAIALGAAFGLRRLIGGFQPD